MSLEVIITRHARDIELYRSTGDLTDPLFEALYEYYLSNGEMPYGTAKARDGDPYQWIAGQLDDVLVWAK